MIRRREEKSFQRRGVRRNILDQRGIFRGSQKIAGRHEISRLQVPRDIKHRFAFAHCEWLFEYLPVGQLPEHVMRRSRLIEKIFTRLQRALRMPPRVKFERHRVAHHAFSFQQPRHAAARSSVRHFHKNSFRGKAAIGLFNAEPQPRGPSRGKQQ